LIILEFIWQILLIIGSLGVFIFGMKMMSDGIQKLAGKRLREILRTVTSHPAKGIFTGFVTTSLVQSSSATTVMVVSFVNAGLLTLTESFGLIMGANIGTTLTSWIVNYAGLKVDITPLAIVLVGLAMPLMFSSRNQLRNLAEFIIGFGILFIGLQFLKSNVPDLDDPANIELLEFLNRYTNMGFLSTLLFIGIGALLTVIVQSSSASTAITLVMVANGWISFPIAAAMVLGENVGTTITANMAALVANNNAKRAARFHFLFNVVGVIWMLFAFNWVIQFLEKIPLGKEETIQLVDINVSESIASAFQADPDRENFLIDSIRTAGLDASSLVVMPDQMDPEKYALREGYGYLKAARLAGVETLKVTVDSPNDRLPLFHTFFNVANVLLLMWFLPFFEKLVYRIVPSSSEDEEETSLQYIVAGIMETPELSIEEARKETAQMGKLTQKMLSNVIMLYFGKPRDKLNLIDKIRRREEITDQMELEIANFLSAISEKDISSSGSQRIQSLLAIINELERIADIFCRLALSEPKLQEDQIVIPEEVKAPIQRLFDLVLSRIKQMAADLEADFSKVDLSAAEAAEKEIDAARDQLNLQIFRSLEKGKITALQSIAFLNLVSSIERVGDLVLSVNRYMAGHK